MREQTGVPMSSTSRIEVNEQVWLSALEAGDKNRCVLFLNDREMYEYLLRVPYPYGEADFEKFLLITQEATKKHGHPVHYAIRHAEHGLIGGFGFEELCYGHRVELGYWLGKPYWGQGIMTAVVGAAAEFAFQEWQLVRITARVFLSNNASARVLQKNGFQLEGVLNKRLRKGDEFIDAKLYALTR